MAEVNGAAGGCTRGGSVLWGVGCSGGVRAERGIRVLGGGRCSECSGGLWGSVQEGDGVNWGGERERGGSGSRKDLEMWGGCHCRGEREDTARGGQGKRGQSAPGGAGKWWGHRERGAGVVGHRRPWGTVGPTNQCVWGGGVQWEGVGSRWGRWGSERLQRGHEDLEAVGKSVHWGGPKAVGNGSGVC